MILQYYYSQVVSILRSIANKKIPQSIVMYMPCIGDSNCVYCTASCVGHIGDAVGEVCEAHL